MNTAFAPYLYQEELYSIPSPVIVVLSQPWHSNLEEEKVLLTKILGSVKLGLASVQLVFHPELSVSTLKTLKAKKVLVFGNLLQDQVKPYEVVDREGISVLRADELKALDDAKKKSLWHALRQMFGA